MSDTNQRTIGWVFTILGGLSIAVLAISFLFSPAEVAAGTIQASLGIEVASCPGCALCGLSRAFSLASHGEWRDSMELNILFLPTYGACWALALATPVALGRLTSPRKAHGDRS